MSIVKIERFLARNLPGNFLKDTYVRGMRRLAEYGFFTGLTEVDTKFGFRMIVNRLDAVKWFIYYFGVFEPHISLAWSRLLRDGDVVIDIGGNVGYHALLAAKLVGSNGKVITFEPSRIIFDQLCKHIEINKFDNIRPLKLAISNYSGEAEFYYAGDNIQGNSSLLKSESSSISERVKCITFQKITDYVTLSDVNLIKIDVEGAELLVLSGLSQCIDQLAKDVVIFVEISPENTESAHSILKPFVDAGFEARIIKNEYSTKFYRSSANVIFSPLEIHDGKIHDVVLSRDPSRFDVMEALTR